uniref:Alpha 3-alpha domain protein n=1 Tax=Siphoviridae sp. ctKy93 TaxID=2827569 RepID=A0A8S5RRH1_9CAUD|nr:MAG TPA: alpha 3-alpha domain protein [Siphoviridae sp. ctKy93]DAZ76729.1 MAG TPA: alpha 3-alpha domain protein [Caudoviricetes sp.]
MARLWYIKIVNSHGAVTIDDVPEKWRDEVKKMLEKRK